MVCSLRTAELNILPSKRKFRRTAKEPLILDEFSLTYESDQSKEMHMIKLSASLIKL